MVCVYACVCVAPHQCCRNRTQIVPIQPIYESQAAALLRAAAWSAVLHNDNVCDSHAFWRNTIASGTTFMPSGFRCCGPPQTSTLAQCMLHRIVRRSARLLAVAPTVVAALLFSFGNHDNWLRRRQWPCSGPMAVLQKHQSSCNIVSDALNCLHNSMRLSTHAHGGPNVSANEPSCSCSSLFHWPSMRRSAWKRASP